MNLETLKAFVRKVEQVQWNGQTLYLRKIGASDGAALIEKIKALSGESLNESRDRDETINFHAAAISKSVADEHGNLLLDSDEARDELKAMAFSELVELGELVLKHSGFGSEKKSSPTKNVLASDSALLSDSGLTPTTSTPV